MLPSVSAAGKVKTKGTGVLALPMFIVPEFQPNRRLADAIVKLCVTAGAAE